MQVIAIGRGYAKRLLGEAVGFVSIAIRLIIVLVLVTNTAQAVWRLAVTCLWPKAGRPLALHLAVGQEAPRNPARAP